MPHQCTDCGRTFDDGSKEMLSGCPSCGGNKFQFLPDGATSEGSTEPKATPAEDSTGRSQPGSTVARTVGSAATAVRDLVGSSDTPPERGAPADSDAAAMAEPATADGEAVSAAEPATEPTPGSDRRDEQTASGRAQRTEGRERPGSSVSEPTSETPATNRGPSRTERTTPQRDGERSRRSAVRPQAGADAAEPTTATMAESENAAQASARSEVVSPDELPSSTESTVRSRAAEEWSRSVPDSTEETEPPKETDRPDLSELREELNQQFESIKVCEPGQYELNLMELFDREEYIIALQEDGKYTVQVPEHWQE